MDPASIGLVNCSWRASSYNRCVLAGDRGDVGSGLVCSVGCSSLISQVNRIHEVVVINNNRYLEHFAVLTYSIHDVRGGGVSSSSLADIAFWAVPYHIGLVTCMAPIF